MMLTFYSLRPALEDIISYYSQHVGFALAENKKALARSSGVSLVHVLRPSRSSSIEVFGKV